MMFEFMKMYSMSELTKNFSKLKTKYVVFPLGLSIILLNVYNYPFRNVNMKSDNPKKFV